MFYEKSIRDWCNSLTSKDKEYVRFVVRKYKMEHNSDTTVLEALIYARKAMILRNAIGCIASIQLKTPLEVYNELKAAKG